MEVHFSDLLFLFLQNYDPDYFSLTESREVSKSWSGSMPLTKC